MKKIKPGGIPGLFAAVSQQVFTGIFKSSFRWLLTGWFQLALPHGRSELAGNRCGEGGIRTRGTL
jgi:hypothetical protein